MAKDLPQTVQKGGQKSPFITINTDIAKRVGVATEYSDGTFYDDLRSAVAKQATTLEECYYTWAITLYLIRRTRAYKQWGYSSFVHWIEVEYPLWRHKAVTASTMGKHIMEKGIPIDRLRTYRPTAVRMVVSREKNAAAALNVLAECPTVTTVAKHYGIVPSGSKRIRIQWNIPRELAGKWRLIAIMAQYLSDAKTQRELDAWLVEFIFKHMFPLCRYSVEVQDYARACGLSPDGNPANEAPNRQETEV